MTHSRIGFRTRLLLTVVGSVAATVVVAVGAFYLLLGQRLDADATALAKANATAELSTLEMQDGRLVARENGDEQSLDSRLWVFAGGRAIDTPPASTELSRVATSLAGAPEGVSDLREETRFYALPVVVGGARRGTVVAAIALAPYERTGRVALGAAVVLAAVLLVSVAVISRWVLDRALRPVSQMTVDASTWSERDLERRFDLGEPYDEITRLGSTLDGLLERIAAALRHEQRFTAELSHEIRTPLARISATAELMLRRDRAPEEYRAALDAIHTNAGEMTRTVETLVAAARQEAGLVAWTSDVRSVASVAVDNARIAEPSLDVRFDTPSEPVPVSVEPDLLERMLQPIVANAVDHAREMVSVTVQRAEHTATVAVTDDGPGVPADERDRIFEPGARGRAARPGGAGLGLSLARRLARSAGGDVVASPDPGGGRFVLQLPLAR